METDTRKVNLTREIKELMKDYMSNDNVNLVVDLMIKREDRLYDVIQKGINDEITLMQTIGNLKINLNIAIDALNQIKSSESHLSDDLKIATAALKAIQGILEAHRKINCVE